VFLYKPHQSTSKNDYAYYIYHEHTLPITGGGGGGA